MGEENQSLQNISHGSHHLSRHGQMGQKGTDFWGAHVRRMAGLDHGAGHLVPFGLACYPSWRTERSRGYCD
jgi:hypothetical protein